MTATGDLRSLLREALGERCAVEESGALRLSPQSDRELLSVLKLLRERGGHLGQGVRLSRGYLSQIGAPDPRSGLIEAEAGAPLDAVDRAASAQGLTLGPLSPRAWTLPLAEFLEGPYAGLRAIPGGRLEPLAVSLSALMPDGLISASRAAPRHAAGPDLDAFFLGAGGRTGLILRATLRLFPRPSGARSATFSFPSSRALISAVRRSLLDGCWVERLRVQRREDRSLLEARFVGSADSVERDLATLSGHATAQGGRAAAQDLPPAEPRPATAAAAAAAERELSWEEVAAALDRGEPGALYRPSVEAAIAEGLSGGRDLSAEGAWGSALVSQLLAELDPPSALGGPPS